METGFKALDERYGGIGNTALWVLAARPAQGKTALAMNIAYNIARQGKDVLIFSMEMGKEELGDRLMASASGVNSKKIRSGELEGQDWNALSAGVLKLKPLKIHIVDIPAIDIHRAKAIARKFKRHGGIGLIVIDYLQLMTDSKAKSRFDEVSSVSRELKVLAKMIGCPVLALSQLNRSVEARPNKRPQMADLRESGQIEQDADIISFIYRDDYYLPDSPNKNTAEIITAKFREGEVGVDILGTQLQFSRFIDFDPSSYIYDWSDNKTNGDKNRASF
jgi:replicative DNA helicase